GKASGGNGGAAGGTGGASAGNGVGGSSATGGDSGAGASGGASGTGAEGGGSGDSGAGGGGPVPTSCDALDPVATDSPDRVVGDGTPGSCTADALAEAAAAGGVITFDCG